MPGANDLRFLVSISKDDLENLAISEDLGNEAPTAEQICDILKEAIMAGFEEYTGEPVDVRVRPTA